jgi:hypothetical protein
VKLYGTAHGYDNKAALRLFSLGRLFIFQMTPLTTAPGMTLLRPAERHNTRLKPNGYNMRPLRGRSIKKGIVGGIIFGRYPLQGKTVLGSVLQRLFDERCEFRRNQLWLVDSVDNLEVVAVDL